MRVSQLLAIAVVAARPLSPPIQAIARTASLPPATVQTEPLAVRQDTPTQATPTSTTAATSPAALISSAPLTTALATTPASDAGGRSNIPIFVPLFVGLVVLGIFIWFIGFGPGHQMWAARARARRMAEIARLNAEAGGEAGGEARDGEDENRHRARRGRRTPPRRTESGRSIRTLPVYTSEAGDEEIVLLQRDRSMRTAHHARPSLGTLDEGAEAERPAQDDRYSLDLGWQSPPSYHGHSVHSAPPYESWGRGFSTLGHSRDGHSRDGHEREDTREGEAETATEGDRGPPSSAELDLATPVRSLVRPRRVAVPPLAPVSQSAPSSPARSRPVRTLTSMSQR